MIRYLKERSYSFCFFYFDDYLKGDGQETLKDLLRWKMDFVEEKKS